MSPAVRARYLVAMGLLPSVALGLGACRDLALPDSVPAAADGAAAPVAPADAPPPPVNPVVEPPPVNPVVEPPPPPVEPPKITIRRVAAPGSVWTLYEEPTFDARAAAAELPRATCPSGQYCVGAPSVVGSPAPAPYADCEATTSDHRPSQTTFRADLTEREREVIEGACCYSWYEHCPGGRPLRADGVAVLADPTPREDWATEQVTPGQALDRATRERLTRHWLAEAAAEHASVASFSRFSLQLLALGAAPELIRAAHQAALDEIRHAQECYALASRYGAQRFGPAALEIPAGALPVAPEVVALETLRDGCLGESLAARCAAEAAAVAHDPHIAQVLADIAADEEAHAELAWRTVAWLLERHPEPVRRVIEGFLASLTTSAPAPSPTPELAAEAGADDQAHGVLGPARHLAVQRAAVREIVVPCLQALLDGPGSARLLA